MVCCHGHRCRRFLPVKRPWLTDGVKYYIIGMPRKARIDYPGLTHHVMARTFSEWKLFCDESDREFFVVSLEKRVIESGCRCYAWSLMDTHYHLLIHTSEKPLWQIMKPLNTDYAHYFNKRRERRGPLFADRYKSIATQDQNYLERLVRYIHLNPFRAGVCRTIEELHGYRWSGDSALMSNWECPFQDTTTVLNRFGATRSAARRNYDAFLRESADGAEGDMLGDIIRKADAGRRGVEEPRCWVIGDPEFTKALLRKDKEHRLTLQRNKREGITLEDILTRTAQRLGIDKETLRAPSKRTPQASARMVFSHFAREYGFSTRRIGQLLGIQQAAVSNAARKGEQIAREKEITLE